MRRSTRGVLSFIVVALVSVATARGDDLKPEEVKKMYDDALVQLKAAQERKNQLAADNEKLTAQVAALQKQMAQMQEQMDEMKRTDADHSEKTFFLRSHYAAWQEFIRQYPELYERWKAYMGSELLSSPRRLPEGIRLDLPLDDGDYELLPPRSATTHPVEDETIPEGNC